MDELSKLREEEKRLIDKINVCRPTPSGILQMGGAITLCEDEDDWKVITLNERIKLKEVRTQIARLTLQ